MAHPEQVEFIKSCLIRFRNEFKNSKNILEIGSQNINGSIRDYFEGAKFKNWVGLDLGKGKDVDYVIPGELIQLPNGWADIAFSTECFEHAENWQDILLNIIRITHQNSFVILTFAGIGRATHGTIDSNIDSSPFTTSYYKNISIEEFSKSLELNNYFTKYSLEVNNNHGDTYFWGIRNDNYKNTELMSLEDSLSRARGQINLLIKANKNLEFQLDLFKNPFKAINKLFKKIYLVIKTRFTK